MQKLNRNKVINASLDAHKVMTDNSEINLHLKFIIIFEWTEARYVINRVK